MEQLNFHIQTRTVFELAGLQTSSSSEFPCQALPLLTGEPPTRAVPSCRPPCPPERPYISCFVFLTLTANGGAGEAGSSRTRGEPTSTRCELSNRTYAGQEPTCVRIICMHDKASSMDSTSGNAGPGTPSGRRGALALGDTGVGSYPFGAFCYRLVFLSHVMITGSSSIASRCLSTHQCCAGTHRRAQVVLFW